MQIQLGNIQIKSKNTKLLEKLKREAIKPSQNEMREELKGVAKLEAFLKREENLKKKLAVLKAKIKAKYGQRKFKRRRFGYLRLSEWEKQVLHIRNGIPFKALNKLRARSWGEFKKKIWRLKNEYRRTD